MRDEGVDGEAAVTFEDGAGGEPFVAFDSTHEQVSVFGNVADGDGVNAAAVYVTGNLNRVVVSHSGDCAVVRHVQPNSQRAVLREGEGGTQRDPRVTADLGLLRDDHLGGGVRALFSAFGVLFSISHIAGAAAGVVAFVEGQCLRR